MSLKPEVKLKNQDGGGDRIGCTEINKSWANTAIFKTSSIQDYSNIPNDFNKKGKGL
jgi:hypothetical protein